MSHATKIISSYISALDDQGWDVKQELLADWLKEEGSERTWPTVFHGKTREIVNDKDGKRKHLTVFVEDATLEEFKSDHCLKNAGTFVLTTRVKGDLHCMYASEWVDGKILCMNSWGKDDPNPSVEKGRI